MQNLPFSLGMPVREVWVWLPPGYDSSAAAGERFAVMYCQDGQNLMDATTSWLNADWNLGRAATLLLDEVRLDGSFFFSF